MTDIARTETPSSPESEFATAIVIALKENAKMATKLIVVFI
jgi:hypothetical protein